MDMSSYVISVGCSCFQVSVWARRYISSVTNEGAAGILIGGAGMSSSPANCALGIYACVVLYALSKVLIYLFLAEKVCMAPPNVVDISC